MASLSVRRLDTETKARLRIRAARHGRSMEEEAREILKGALAGNQTEAGNLADSIRRRFAPLGGVVFPDLPRQRMRRAPRFAK